MSLFLAEKGPGFSVVRKLEKLGYKRHRLRPSWCSRTTACRPTT